MRLFNPKELALFYKIFPELSPVQTETVLLFSMGFALKEVASLRHISPQNTKKTLSQAMKKFSVFSLNALRSTVHIRLIILSFQEIYAQKQIKIQKLQHILPQKTSQREGEHP